MADGPYDHDPGEQKRRVAGHLLEDGEKEVAGACASLLLSLVDPLDLPAWVELYSNRRYNDRARTAALCKRAARAALAVLIADDGMQLPEFIEVAYDMPKPPAVELQALLAEQRALNANLQTIAGELALQRKPAVRQLIDLARQAQVELEAGGDGATRMLASDLGATLREVAA